MRVPATKWLWGIGIVISVLLASASAVSANAILDFATVTNLIGTIGYAGGANPLVGTDIKVDSVRGTGTPLDDGGLLACVDCVLNFTSGSFSGSNPTTWFFNGPGATSISIVGKIPSIGLNSPTVLMTGEVRSGSVLAVFGDLKLSLSTFVDSKNPTLTAHYGLDAFGWSGFSSFNFTAAGSPPDAFTSTVIASGDTTNEKVPEPATAVLFASAVLPCLMLTMLRRHRPFTAGVTC